MTDIDSLFDSLEALQADKKLPPVAQWQPERVGQIDIRIARDGAWYHEGAPFKRPALVKLFSTVLRRDPDGFCLVTPAEKLLIEVEDVPFLAIDFRLHQRFGDTPGIVFAGIASNKRLLHQRDQIILAKGFAHPVPFLTSHLTRRPVPRRRCVPSGS